MGTTRTDLELFQVLGDGGAAAACTAIGRMEVSSRVSEFVPDGTSNEAHADYTPDLHGCGEQSSRFTQDPTVCALTHQNVGLAHVVEDLARRYTFDDSGRMTGGRDRPEGGTPRFVLGRAREGVVWRFRSDLDTGLIVEIGRLAAREQGFPIDGEQARAPDRLAAIVERIDRHDRARSVEGRSPRILEASSERRRSVGGSGESGVRHHWVSHEGSVVGELWTID